MKDLYSILGNGTSPVSSQDEIDSAYNKAVKIRHPDVGGTHEDFVDLQTAYETLSDPEKRRFYHETGCQPETDARQIERLALGLIVTAWQDQLNMLIAVPNIQSRKFISLFNERLDGIVSDADQASNEVNSKIKTLEGFRGMLTLTGNEKFFDSEIDSRIEAERKKLKDFERQKAVARTAREFAKKIIERPCGVKALESILSVYKTGMPELPHWP